jgi:hypothetical protein
MSANNKQGFQPQLREYLDGLSTLVVGQGLKFTILTADVAPAPTAAIWSYTVKFEIQDASGNGMEAFDGDVTAAAADTSTAGTASVDDTSPAVVNGVGTVVLSGDAADWLNTETATCTLTHTLNGNTVTSDVFTVTFTT